MEETWEFVPSRRTRLWRMKGACSHPPPSPALPPPPTSQLPRPKFEPYLLEKDTSVSKMVANNKESASSVSALAQQEAVSEGIEAFELPRSIITRLARSAVSEEIELLLNSAKSSCTLIDVGEHEDVKRRRFVVPESIYSFHQLPRYVFFSCFYLRFDSFPLCEAATAHEVAASKQHKSISATDVLKALELVEMGDMVPKLQQELQGTPLYHVLLLSASHVPSVYRDVQKTGRGGKGKARESLVEVKSASAASSSRPRQKTKEKERGPTITISRPQAKAPSRAPEPEYERVGVNGHVHEDGDEAEYMGEEDEEVDEEDEDGDDDDVGDEELEDPMVVDDEDTRRDERDLDDEDDGE